jgi:hypothetical protein
MMIILPITNDGCRQFSVNTPAGLLTFTTYWLPLAGLWACDISDSNGADLMTGIALVAGTPNLLTGNVVTSLQGYALEVLKASDGEGERAYDAWGNSALLLMRGPNDAPNLVLPDPMLSDE